MKKIFCRNKKRFSSGHSLVELMIAIGILVFIGLGIFMYSMVAQNDIKKITTSSVSLKEARIALEYIKRDMASAKMIADSYSTYSTGNSSIVMEYYQLDSNLHPITSTWPATPDYIVYYVSNGNLYRKVFPYSGSSRQPFCTGSNDPPIAKNISNLMFSYNGTNLGSIGNKSTAPGLKVILTVTTGMHMSRTEAQTLTTEVYFRNF
jgi:type II secretory pathway component PulJ